MHKFHARSKFIKAHLPISAHLFKPKVSYLTLIEMLYQLVLQE